MRDVIAYAASMRRVRDIADEHYRQFSLGTADVDAFHSALDRESKQLWQRFGTGGQYSQPALMNVLFARFGTIATLGKPRPVVAARQSEPPHLRRRKRMDPHARD